MTSLPIKGYAREYGSAEEMLAAYRARQALPWKQAAKPEEPAPVMVAARPEREARAQPATGVCEAVTSAAGKSQDEARPGAVPWAVVRKQYRLHYASTPLRGKTQAGAIIAAVASETGIAIDALKGEQRVARIARARQLAIWRVADETELSLSEIGRLFHRDHTTVLHAIRVTNQRRGADVRGYGGIPVARSEGKTAANRAPERGGPR
ncbi:helix-turn-helix domain-containing protein [Bosea sp. 2KB_26]|uniref:helix-turn-helix domain-containing protein n=2 Tax=Pseudomonadota TaxID=1224 RepID=UPI003F917896